MSPQQTTARSSNDSSKNKTIESTASGTTEQENNIRKDGDLATPSTSEQTQNEDAAATETQSEAKQQQVGSLDNILKKIEITDKDHEDAEGRAAAAIAAAIAKKAEARKARRSSLSLNKTLALNNKKNGTDGTKPKSSVFSMLDVTKLKMKMKKAKKKQKLKPPPGYNSQNRPVLAL